MLHTQDNATYPVLFLDYLTQVVVSNNNRASDRGDGTNGCVDGDDVSEILSPILRFSFLAGTTILLAYVNWRGLDLVGQMSSLICVLSMTPFLILIVVGSSKLDPSRWFVLPETEIATTDTTTTTAASDDDALAYNSGGLLWFLPAVWTGGSILWGPFVNNLFWNLTSFDNAGYLMEEFDSKASFPKASAIGFVMVVLCYLVPVLVATGSSESEQSDWTDGYLATINAEVVGPWLGAWTVFAAGISNIALFEAELSANAFQLIGMADRGYLPGIFRRRSRHGTPTHGILLAATVVVALVSLSPDLEGLVEMLNFNYALAQLFQYAAFLELRVSRPDLERPYKIPIESTLGCAFFFAPTIAITVLVMGLASYSTMCFSVGSWIVGYLLYAAKEGNGQRMINSNSDSDNEQQLQTKKIA